MHGRLLTELTPNHIDASMLGQWVPLDVGGEFTLGDSSNPCQVDPFVVAFVKQGPDPKPMADATDDQGGLTYTWFGGPWTDGDWGRYSTFVDLAMRVKVEYDLVTPVTVQMAQFPSTYRQQGPFNVNLTLTGPPECGDPMGISGENGITFHWARNGAEQTADILPVSVDEVGNGLYQAAIEGDFAPNDMITYWVSYRYNGDYIVDTPTDTFFIKTPQNPGADLLLIADHAVSSQRQQNLYAQVLQTLGMTYEYWDTQVAGLYDSTVVNGGWSTIILYGDGIQGLPLRQGEFDRGFSHFLEQGGNLVVIDQDLLNRYAPESNVTFTTGDFAHDYLGLVGGINNPVDAEGHYNADPLLMGAGLTPIDSGFTTMPLQLNHALYGVENRGDFLFQGEGVSLFTGVTDSQDYGISHSTNQYQTAVLSFMADAAVDTLADGTLIHEQFTQVLAGVLAWVQVSSPPQITNINGPSGIRLSGPYTVSATIRDYDGDPIDGVQLQWGDGETWNTVPMTLEGELYQAQIPDIEIGGYYYWRITATAAGETTMQPGYGSDPFVFQRFVPTAPVLVYFNGGSAEGYPGAYYFGTGNYQSYQTVNFPHDTWETALTPELVDGYCAIIEITTFGPTFDSREIISNWLESGGLKYFLAGDEWLSFISNRTDTTFTPGSFVYDILGISHVYNDISLPNPGLEGAVPIDAVAGNWLTGQLYAAHHALGDTLLYAPYYEISSPNRLDAFDPVNPEEVCMVTLDDPARAIGLFRSSSFNYLRQVVFLSFDPLSIDATPYTWWGFAEESPQTAFLNFLDACFVGINNFGARPDQYGLEQNYPNPFNPTTTIAFDVPRLSYVTVSVYNLLGQRIIELAHQNYSPGRYQLVWDGRNAKGHAVASGTYFYKMEAGDFSQTRKMVYLK